MQRGLGRSSPILTPHAPSSQPLFRHRRQQPRSRLRITPAPQRTSPPCARQSPLKITRPKKSLVDTLSIAGLFGVWYMSNIYFNIYNKQVLTAFGHPAACTLIHLGVSSLLAVALWLTRIKKVPPFSPRVVDIIFPLAILHLFGFFLTNASLGAVAVSLTHTIKSMEPFFTVVLSWLLMRARPAKRVLASLLPIVAGVVVASATDISFTWAGFNAAMLSNVAFQTRNVLSKKAMMRTSYESLEGGGSDMSTLDEVNIFALMSIGAACIGLPLVAALDGPSLWQLGHSPADWMSADMWRKSILAGICRFGDVLASFLILQKVNPVTHSVGNCVKRVVVIAASIVVFKTAASSANIAGTAVALVGVLLYSLAKRSVGSKVDFEAAIEATPLENALASISPGSLYSRFFAPKEVPKPTAEGDDLEYYL